MVRGKKGRMDEGGVCWGGSGGGKAGEKVRAMGGGGEKERGKGGVGEVGGEGRE